MCYLSSLEAIFAVVEAGSEARDAPRGGGGDGVLHQAVVGVDGGRIVDVRGVAGVEGLGGVAPVRHLLEPLPLLLRQVVPPDGALLVELLDLLVDELVRVLSLVLRPAGLDEDAIRRVLLLPAVLRHLVVMRGTQTDTLSICRALPLA